MTERRTTIAALALGWCTMTGCETGEGQRTRGSASDAGGAEETTHGPTDSVPSDTTSMGDGHDGDDGAQGCRPPSPEGSSETISVFTSDDKEIVGTVHRPHEGTCLPAVLLVHQYMRDRWQWGGMPERLMQRGYVVLAIDLRGHGDSDEQDGHLPELLTDPDQAPLDARAAFEWLHQQPEVDNERIAIVGTSIGAYLAGVAAVDQWGVAASVAVSPLTDAIRTLARHEGPIVFGDLYCISSEFDADGAQARSCVELVDAASGDAQIRIFEGTGEHGVEILEAHPEVEAPILEWLDTVLR